MKWHSTISGNLIDGNELLQEVAHKTVCRLYWLEKVLQCPAPILEYHSNGISVVSSEIDFRAFTPIPDELITSSSDKLNLLVHTIRGEYGMQTSGLEILPPSTPSGEKLGKLLRTFSALRELCSLCRSRDCWNKSNFLLIHGLFSEFVEPAKMMDELTRAGIYFLIAFNDKARLSMEAGLKPAQIDIDGSVGCGAFISISKYDATNIALSLNDGSRDLLAKVLHLQKDYNEDSWASNHPEFGK